MANANRRPVAAGSILIVLGLVFLAKQQFGWHFGWEVALILLGLAFLIGYAARREYGLLIPGCVLTGLGCGQFARELGAQGEPGLLGLGLGFVGIYVIGLLFREPRGNWWPLIPGVILILLSQNAFRWFVERLTDNWPLILIVVGVLMVLGGLRGRRPRRSAGG